MLKDYEPYAPLEENASFELKSITELPPYLDLPAKKISLILERKLPLATLDLFRISEFVDFRDYFGLFSIFFAGVIYEVDITPAKKVEK
jgi:hypothetical protein